MPRPPPNYDYLREEIEVLLQVSGLTHNAVRAWMKEQKGVDISHATFERVIAAWGITTRPRRADLSAYDEERLRARIEELFWESDEDDATCYEILTIDGFALSKWQFVELRKSMGLYRRIPKDDQPSYDEIIKSVLVGVIKGGALEDYGYRNLAREMRNEFKLIGRNRIFKIAYRMNSAPFDARRIGKRVKVRSYLPKAKGPNHIWSVDAYCKLELFGIQIYCCINVYSRKIIWAYVGTMAKTKFSVFSQYLSAVDQLGFTPQILRADHSVETPMMADAHLCFRENQEGHQLRFNKAFWYTTSKGNNTIERFWGLGASAAFNRWRDLFIELRNNRLYDEDQRADRVAFLAVYVPIMRYTVWLFVGSHNRHRIRKHPEITGYVAGIPNTLYAYPELKGTENYGIYIDTAHPEIRQMVQNKDEFDLISYLPPATMHWVDHTLVEGGFPTELDGREQAANGEKLHVVAYLHLRAAAAAHLAAGGELVEFQRPAQGAGLQPRDRTREVFAANSFPL
ncbi:unnamed protein product [Zymoseptoria tritici ST99CH_1A5]|uniref:Integrase core domain-containing protein n=1 Tax=Zymoseptoria tritici ST99CH_1A5 TaxID=1276529 RepID=A0A1Y6L5E4_ZYMTR|nr:unnamed protein product [Zymoseptoria tritici ST99CH_1A5]